MEQSKVFAEFRFIWLLRFKLFCRRSAVVHRYDGIVSEFGEPATHCEARTLVERIVLRQIVIHRTRLLISLGITASPTMAESRRLLHHFQFTDVGIVDVRAGNTVQR